MFGDIITFDCVYWDDVVFFSFLGWKISNSSSQSIYQKCLLDRIISLLFLFFFCFACFSVNFSLALSVLCLTKFSCHIALNVCSVVSIHRKTCQYLNILWSLQRCTHSISWNHEIYTHTKQAKKEKNKSVLNVQDKWILQRATFFSFHSHDQPHSYSTYVNDTK